MDCKEVAKVEPALEEDASEHEPCVDGSEQASDAHSDTPPLDASLYPLHLRVCLSGARAWLANCRRQQNGGRGGLERLGCNEHGLPFEQEQLRKALPFVASVLALARALEEETREQLYSIVSRTCSFYDSILSSYDPAVVFLGFCSSRSPFTASPSPRERAAACSTLSPRCRCFPLTRLAGREIGSRN